MAMLSFPKYPDLGCSRMAQGAYYEHFKTSPGQDTIICSLCWLNRSKMVMPFGEPSFSLVESYTASFLAMKVEWGGRDNSFSTTIK